MEASDPPASSRGSRCHGPNKSPKSLQGTLNTAQHRFIMYMAISRMLERWRGLPVGLVPVVHGRLAGLFRVCHLVQHLSAAHSGSQVSVLPRSLAGLSGVRSVYAGHLVSVHIARTLGRDGLGREGWECSVLVSTGEFLR